MRVVIFFLFLQPQLLQIHLSPANFPTVIHYTLASHKQISTNFNAFKTHCTRHYKHFKIPTHHSSEHWSTAGLTTATESWLVYHRSRSTGFNPFSEQQLVLCCSYQAGPVYRIWCEYSSTGFRFLRGSSSSCARWCTGVFTTRRRSTYKNCVCLSHLLRVALTSVRPQLATFASHRQKLWQSASADFLSLVPQLGTIYQFLWKIKHCLSLLLKDISKLNFFVDVISCNALLRRLFERRIRNTVPD